MVAKLEERIKTNQSLLDSAYSRLGERLRSIVDLLDELKGSSVSDKGVNPLKETRICMNHVSELMEETGDARRGLGQFISDYRQNLRQLKIIDQNIGKIHEYSEIMELLAMNTVVFSIQSSKDVGFRYVGDILKKNAKDSIERIGQIVDVGRDLREQFTLMEETILKLKREESVTRFIDRKIRDSLTVVEESQEFFAETTALLDEEIASVHGDMLKIVQEIQYQDIFRQSLDHLTMLLENDNLSGETVEKRLDRLSYMETVCRFGLPLLDEIQARVEGSIPMFQNRLEGIQRDMNHILSRRRKFLQDNLQKSRKKGGILCSVGDMKTTLIEMNRELVAAEKELKSIENLTERSAGIINLLHEGIIELESLILTYYNITRLGKKEMLKYPNQDYLRDSLDNIHKLAKKIERTGETIHRAMTQIEEGRAPVRSNLKRLRDEKRLVTDKVVAQTTKLKEALVRLLDGVKILQEQNSRAGIRLKDELDAAFESAGELKKSAVGLRELSLLFAEFEQTILDEKARALKEVGRDAWEVRDTDFKSLLDRFTIYRQKLALSQLTGIAQKDEGLKEGNIILF